MLVTLAGVPEEPPGRDLKWWPWRSIALRPGMDVLREASFLWFVGARLLILMASGVLLNLLPFYLSRCFGMDRDAAGGAILLLSAVGAFTNAATVVPAARLSDRIGRKRTITISCAIGTVSLLVCALAPAFPVAVAGVVLYGIATGRSFRSTGRSSRTSSRVSRVGATWGSATSHPRSPGSSSRRPAGP